MPFLPTPNRQGKPPSGSHIDRLHPQLHGCKHFWPFDENFGTGANGAANLIIHDVLGGNHATTNTADGANDWLISYDGATAANQFTHPLTGAYMGPIYKGALDISGRLTTTYDVVRANSTGGTWILWYFIQTIGNGAGYVDHDTTAARVTQLSNTGRILIVDDGGSSETMNQASRSPDVMEHMAVVFHEDNNPSWYRNAELIEKESGGIINACAWNMLFSGPNAGGTFYGCQARYYNRALNQAEIRDTYLNPFAPFSDPLPVWISAAAGATTVTKTADLDLLAQEQNILKTATLDLIAKKLNTLTADMDIRVLKVNQLLADMDLLAKKLDNLKTADMDLLAKTLNNLKQADLDFIVNATKFLEADQDFLAKKLDNLTQADMDLLAKKLDNLEQADLDFLAKQIDILNNVDLDFIVKTVNNLKTADLDLLAKKLDNLKQADLDFIASAANTITIEADLDFLTKVLDNLKTADLDFLAKTVDNLKTADLDFIAKTIDNLKLADIDFLAKTLDNIKTADLDFLAKTIDNLELIDLDFIVKKTTLLEATLDVIVAAGTVLKTATLDMLAKKLDNIKQLDIDFVVVQELVLALCSRVTQIAALLAGNVTSSNYLDGTMTFSNALAGGAQIEGGLLSGETSGGLLTATIDVDTVCD